MKQSTRLSAPEGALFQDSEWNFDHVPNEELVACCYWEYARESAFIRDVRLRCADRKWLTMTNSQAWAYVGNDLARIQSIGYSAEVFLSGFFFEPGTVYQSVDEKASRYRHPKAPSITGSFPLPWQSLSRTERRDRAARVRTDREAIPLVPFSRGYAFMADWIAEYCQAQRRATAERQQSVREKNPGVSEVELCQKGKRRFPEVVPSIFSGGAEIGVLRIEWGSYTNEELRDGFYRWLKANRPAGHPAPDGRGRKVVSVRVSLEQLAVLRLLHRFTLAELKAGCPAAWKRYATPNRRWRREAEKACQRFHQLFPFLPASDRPLA
ncbi:MAG: hypothetical protein AAB676_05685 [Verrucomicrobiota bacterium]